VPFARVTPVHHRAIAPFHLLIAVAFFGAVFIAAGDLTDPDLYWHIPVGADIVHHHHVEGAGSQLSFTVDGRHWKTTQWLAEVGFYFIHAHWGYAGIRGLTVVLSVGVLLLLLRAIRRESPTLPATALVFAVVAVPLAVHLEDRAATLSLLLLAAITPYFLDLLHGAAARGTVWIAVYTWVWANFHGYWVLVPGSLVLLAVCRLVDGLPRREAAWPALQAVVATGAACLTPIGVSAVTSVARFHAATTIISEWAYTSVGDVATWALLAVIAAIVVGWARGTTPVRWGELTFTGAWVLFSLLAFRNTLPAIVTLAPLAARRLADVVRFPETERGVRERRLLTVAAATLALLGIALVGVRIATTSAIPRSVPRQLIALLREQPGEHRVLDDYNHSGQVVGLGGPRTKVAVDGRADLYGATYLRNYVNMLGLGPHWARTLGRIPANYALIRHDAAIRVVLADRGWRLLGAQRGFVLLAAPGTPVVG
jgi:hypothetical protein